MKNSNLFVLFTVALFLISAPVFCQAQSSSNTQEDQPLHTQFQEILDKAETYTEYKVIKITDLDTYSESLQDSLQAYSAEINTLKNEVIEQKSQVSPLNIRIAELEKQLAASEEMRDSYAMFGLSNVKTYQWIVWIIFGSLTAFGIYAYTSYIRSNNLTSKTIMDYEVLELELQDNKKKSYEKQLKLGRELQTERNKVEDLKVSLKSKNTGKP